MGQVTSVNVCVMGTGVSTKFQGYFFWGGTF